MLKRSAEDGTCNYDASIVTYEKNEDTKKDEDTKKNEQYPEIMSSSSDEETHYEVEQPAADRQVEYQVAEEGVQPQNLKKGMIIKYKADNDTWKEGKVLSRAGKATGWYKSHWNVEESCGGK